VEKEESIPFPTLQAFGLEHLSDFIIKKTFFPNKKNNSSCFILVNFIGH
jgi:hypothetical protein